MYIGDIMSEDAAVFLERSDIYGHICFVFCPIEALVNNPKIEVRDGTYGFKPKYNLKDKKALLRLLDKHDQLGLGGVLLDDVEEGLPNSAKAIKVTPPVYSKLPFPENCCTHLLWRRLCCPRAAEVNKVAMEQVCYRD